MLLLLLLSTTWTLSSLAVHSTSAYSPRDVYRNSLTEKAREAVAEVIGSISRSKRTQDPEVDDVTELLNFLLQPHDRLEKDLQNLRILLELMGSPTRQDTIRQLDNLEMSGSEEDNSVEVPVKRSRPIALRSRSCYLRLGGHCVTEDLDKAMRQKLYLSSINSPGRKRRSLQSILTNQI